MFLQVRKGPQIFVQHIAMDSQYLAPVTSNFRINLNLVAEISTYSLKERKTKKALDGRDIDLPVGTRVIHLEMSFTHASHTEARGSDRVQVNERYFYKLVFFSEAEPEYVRIKNILDRHTEIN